MFHLITNMFYVCTGRCTYFYRNQLSSNALSNLFMAFPSFTDRKVSNLGNALSSVRLLLFVNGTCVCYISVDVRSVDR